MARVGAGAKQGLAGTIQPVFARKNAPPELAMGCASPLPRPSQPQDRLTVPQPAHQGQDRTGHAEGSAAAPLWLEPARGRGWRRRPSQRRCWLQNGKSESIYARFGSNSRPHELQNRVEMQNRVTE